MKRFLILALAGALVLPATDAIAQGKGNKGCPPGLAKKDPPCVPPGLAKKGMERDARDDDDTDVTYDDRYDPDDYVRLAPGDRVRIDGEDYLVINTDDGILLRREDDFYRLPRLDDDRYVRVGDSLIRVNPETQAVIDAIRLADLILN